MDKWDNTTCPVCFLYLREGITLKSHLQTHSKDKVIEALLKQDPSSCSLNEDSVLSNSRTGDNSAVNSSTESRFSNSDHHTTLPFSAVPSAFLQSTNNQVVPPAPSLTYDGSSTQYSSVVNNLVTQSTISNSCNTDLTYQTYVTNEGNIILIPFVNMCPPSAMLSNNMVQTAPVMNSCVVIPPSNNVESMTINNVSSSVTKYESTSSVQNSNVSTVRADETNENEIIECQSVESEDADDNEKATDEEVASIFKGSKPSLQYSTKKDCKRDESVSCNSEMTGCSKSDDESYAATFLESENCSSSSTPSAERIVAVKRTSVNSNVSVVCIQNNTNYHSSIGGRLYRDCYSPLPSVSASTNVPVIISSSNAVEQQKEERKYEILDLSEGGDDSPVSFELESEEYDYDENSENSTDALIPDREKEHYILPNGTSPSTFMSGNFNFIGISKTSLASTSLISSVNKSVFTEVDVFADEKKNTNPLDTCETMNTEEEQVLTNYVTKLTDKEEEEYCMNVSENHESTCSSRVSPFDIQTDESMPERGELSDQESLSSTENSVWELQVKQNTCIEQYNISCQGENSGVEIGLHSLMREMNIKRDVKNLQSMDFEEDKAIGALANPNFKKKPAREFHCFYCQKKFNTWKLRQAHIVHKHAKEDCLTIESLFGKRIKLKVEAAKQEVDSQENENKIELAITQDEISCRMCSVVVKSTVDLLKHLRLSHNINKRSLVCPTCFVCFSTPNEYRLHIQRVHPYECMTCGKQFYTRPGYMLHQKRHMKIKPYSCSVCAKSFITKQKLSEHVNIHTGDNPIKCDMCDSQFKRYSNYQQHKKYLHMNCKRKLKDFICNCGDVFHSKVKLLWHQEIHDQKPKQCPYCVERFVHATSLTRHVRKCHNEMYLSEWLQTKKNIPCPVCNVSYLYTSLRTHMKIHEGVKPFACSECPKMFRTKWNLQLHRWTHMSRSAKPYKCKICVKAYIHKTDYDAHLRSHNNYRPFSCNVCGRQFIRKYNCIRHMREHVEPRSYKCNVCGKKFARSYYLSEHEKVHTGEKPHTCHFCGKASATKSNHNKHMKMHTIARETINSEA